MLKDSYDKGADDALELLGISKIAMEKEAFFAELIRGAGAVGKGIFGGSKMLRGVKLGARKVGRKAARAVGLKAGSVGNAVRGASRNVKAGLIKTRRSFDQGRRGVKSGQARRGGPINRPAAKQSADSFTVTPDKIPDSIPKVVDRPVEDVMAAASTSKAPISAKSGRVGQHANIARLRAKIYMKNNPGKSALGIGGGGLVAGHMMSGGQQAAHQAQQVQPLPAMRYY